MIFVGEFNEFLVYLVEMRWHIECPFSVAARGINGGGPVT